jgi:hypothetical protein
LFTEKQKEAAQVQHLSLLECLKAIHHVSEDFYQEIKNSFNIYCSDNRSAAFVQTAVAALATLTKQLSDFSENQKRVVDVSLDDVSRAIQDLAHSATEEANVTWNDKMVQLRAERVKVKAELVGMNARSALAGASSALSLLAFLSTLSNSSSEETATTHEEEDLIRCSQGPTNEERKKEICPVPWNFSSSPNAHLYNTKEKLTLSGSYNDQDQKTLGKFACYMQQLLLRATVFERLRPRTKHTAEYAKLKSNYEQNIQTTVNSILSYKEEDFDTAESLFIPIPPGQECEAVQPILKAVR